jgi:hypothetical protein
VEIAVTLLAWVEVVLEEGSQLLDMGRAAPNSSVRVKAVGGEAGGEKVYAHLAYFMQQNKKPRDEPNKTKLSRAESWHLQRNRVKNGRA